MGNKIDSHQQTCKACMRPDMFNFYVSDEIWKKIVPEHLQNRVVCLSCFDQFAKERDIDYAKEIDTLYFAGKQATFVFKSEKALNSNDSYYHGA